MNQAMAAGLFHHCRQRRGYARWVIRRCDLMIPWSQWEDAGYQPGTIKRRQAAARPTEQLSLSL